MAEFETPNPLRETPENETDKQSAVFDEERAWIWSIPTVRNAPPYLRRWWAKYFGLKRLSEYDEASTSSDSSCASSAASDASSVCDELEASMCHEDDVDEEAAPEQAPEAVSSDSSESDTESEEPESDDGSEILAIHLLMRKNAHLERKVARLEKTLGDATLTMRALTLETESRRGVEQLYAKRVDELLAAIRPFFKSSLLRRATPTPAAPRCEDRGGPETQPRRLNMDDTPSEPLRRKRGRPSNAPCHFANAILEAKDGLTMGGEPLKLLKGEFGMKWPALSPDLNVIENLWAWLDSKVRAAAVESVGELKHVVDRELKSAQGKAVIGRLCASFERRLRKCIELDGQNVQNTNPRSSAALPERSLGY